MNECIQVINDRRSIRKFKSKELSKQQIEQLLHSAQMAPSAGNLQARDFVVVTKKETKQKLCKAALNQYFIEEAPVVIAVCANYNRSISRYGNRGELYSIQDATASVMNILLTAHSLGLGTCWVGAFYEDKVSEILGIPKSIRPIALIPVGYPDETPIAPPRRSLSEVTHWEKW